MISDKDDDALALMHGAITDGAIKDAAHPSVENPSVGEASSSTAGVTRRLDLRALTPLLAALATQACGGGGTREGESQIAAGTPAASTNTTPTSSPPAVPPSPPSPPSPPTPTGPVSVQDASRFLVQASFGATMPEVQKVASDGYGAWLDAQFQTPRAATHMSFPRRDFEMLWGTVESFWTQAVRGEDQLRQRTTLALYEIFVVSGANGDLGFYAEPIAAYLDMLSNNAFGNFRTLIEAVARSPSMGFFLSHLGNDKEDPVTGRIPDQNFAREIMQLFTIGLWELNPDGSRRLDSAGQPIPTYGQAEVVGMSRVFTGLSWGTNWWGHYDFEKPMIHYAEHTSMSEKRIVGGVVIPPNTSGPDSLRITLDTLFNHPNTAPFFGEQLIKRLVTSNPSRAYVSRVSAAFANNGAGVRGDMRAVLKAVLLDPEARDAARTQEPTWGKLREPILRFSAWLRAFNATNSQGRLALYGYDDPMNAMNQPTLRPPSVFNYFRPDYSPPGSIRTANLVAPEFQIQHESSSAAYANFVGQLAAKGFDISERHPDILPVRPNYSNELPLANNPDALLDRLNLVLMGAQLSATTRTIIRTAIEAIPIGASDAPLRRVQTAVALCMISPDFVVQK
jgi:uncharacterized protein (DUF1800 family)